MLTSKSAQFHQSGTAFEIVQSSDMCFTVLELISEAIEHTSKEHSRQEFSKPYILINNIYKLII